MEKPLRIAILITDNREHDKAYTLSRPYFAAGAASFFEGLAQLPAVEIHIVSCTQKPMPDSPHKLAGNLWFHSLYVPKIGWLRTFYQGCIRAVRRKLKELQPDIVHGWGNERDNAISAVFSGFPNVVTIQGNMAELARMAGAPIGSYEWLTARLENLTLRRTDGVLCNSNYTRTLVQPRTRRTWLVAHALRQPFLETLPPNEARPCVLLNAGVALACAGLADNIGNGIEISREMITSGAALERLRLLKKAAK